MTDLERRRRKKDGSHIDVNISTAPLYDAQGEATDSVILAQDITERRRNGEELVRLLGAERAARNAAEAAQLRFEFLAGAGRVLASSLDYEATLSAVSRLAVPHIADWCSVLIVGNDGSVRQLAAAHVDPTKVKMAEELASEYAFDPGGPVGAQRESAPDTDKLVDGLERIDRTASRMASLINELLDVTRFQMRRPIDLDRRHADLVEIVHSIVDEQQHVSDRHRIRFAVRSPALEGLWDAARLERVLANLLSNAIKYSPEGGDIDVSVGSTADNKWAFVTVHDSGIGIPLADLPRIFERFYRAGNVVGKIAGTGVGLAGARQVVEQHGGCIAVESSKEGGTTFTIRLPTSTEIEANSGAGGAGARPVTQ